MSAPAGNQFWKRRTKHGRDKIFTDPNVMLLACYDYFNYQSQQSWNKKELIRGGDKAGQLINIPTKSPFSIEGLCLFLGVHSKYLTRFESELDLKDKQLQEDFSNVITHVKEIIFLQQTEGATVGVYNHNIVARKLGLVDKSEIDSKTTFNIEIK